MPLKKVTTAAFQTSDGKIYMDEREARDVETRLMLETWRNRFLSCPYNECDEGTVLDAIEKGAEELLPILKEIIEWR